MTTKNRQKHEPIYIGNGAIFITSKKILQTLKRRTGGRTALYPMTEVESLDIHTLWDVKLGEYYLNNKTAWPSGYL